MAEWKIKRGDKQYGPVNTSQLKQLAKQGKLKPTDMLWKEGLEKWSSASNLKCLEFACAAGVSSGNSSPAGAAQSYNSTVGYDVAVVSENQKTDSRKKIAGNYDILPAGKFKLPENSTFLKFRVPCSIHFSDSGEIEIEGMFTDKSKHLTAIIYAAIAVPITFLVLIIVSYATAGVAVGPGFIVWYLIFCNAMNVTEEETYSIPHYGKVIYWDEKRQFCVKVSVDTWLTFKATSQFSVLKKQDEYEAIKYHFNNNIPEQVIPYGKFRA